MKKWMICFVGIVLIVAFGYMVWNNEDGKQREIRLINEYQAIKHPEGADLVHYKLNRKIIKRWISSEYTYPINNDDVKQYYDQELVNNGWKKIKYNSKPGTVFYAYEKDNLRIVLGPYKEKSWTIYMGYPDAEY